MAELALTLTARNLAAQTMRTYKRDIDTVKKSVDMSASATKRLDNNTRQLGGSMRTTSAAAGKFVKAMGAFVVAVGAVRGLSNIIRAGSDTAEMMSKFNVVFSETGGVVQQIVNQYADAVGRSRNELLGMAAAMGDTFKPMGFAEDQAAKLSVRMVQLATDLSSFNNMPMDEALRRLQGTLVGSHENALAFGVIINENAIKAELAAQGWDKLTGAALEQAKVLARYNLLMQGTTDAQGDAARTADSFENQMRRLRGVLADNAAAFGQELLPAITPVVKAMADFASVVLPQVVAAVGPTIQGISNLAKSFRDGLQSIAETVGRITTPIVNQFQLLLHAAVNWGSGLIQAFANGIIQAVSLVVDALNYLSRTIAYWLTPGSPPRILPDIDQWGQGTAEAWLQGWTQADFGILNEVGQKVAAMFESGGVAVSVQNALARAISAVKSGGDVGSVFDNLRSSAAQAGDSVLGLANKYLRLVGASEQVKRVQSELNGLYNQLSQQQNRALSANEDREIRALQGLLATNSASSSERAFAQQRLAELQLQRQIRAKEQQLKTSQDVESQAENELMLYRAQLELQEQQLDILEGIKSTIGSIGSSMGSAATKLKEQLIDKLDLGAALEQIGLGGGLENLALPELDTSQIEASANRIKTAFENIKNSVQPIRDSFDRVREAITDFVGRIREQLNRLDWDSIREAVRNALYHARRFWDEFVHAIQTGDFTPLWNHLKEIGRNIKSWFDETWPVVRDKLATWGKALVGWIGPKIPILLDNLGKFGKSLWGWFSRNAPILVANLRTWGLALVTWVAPRVGAVLRQLAAFGATVWGWFVEQLPVIRDHVTQWGAALIGWIMPRIGVALSQLKQYGENIWSWLKDNAPEIGRRLLMWGKSLTGWISERISPILAEIKSWALSVWDWVTANASRLPALLVSWGAALVDWVKPRVGAVLQQLATWAAAIKAWYEKNEFPANVSEWGAALHEFASGAYAKLKPHLDTWRSNIAAWFESQDSPFANKLKEWSKSLSDWIKNLSIDIRANFVQLQWADVFGFTLDWSAKFAKLTWADVFDFTLDWSAKFVSIDWSDALSFTADWTARFVELSFLDTLQFTADWTAQFINLVWSDDVRFVANWTAKFAQIVWAEGLTFTYDWAARFVSIDWRDDLAFVHDWKANFTSLQWGDSLSFTADWAARFVSLVWADGVSFVSDWTAQFAKIVWRNDLVFVANWHAKFISLAWAEGLTFTADWAARFTSLVWRDDLNFVADWHAKFVSLTWAEGMTFEADWVARFAKLTWQDVFDFTLDWSVNIAKLTWPDVFNFTLDWQVGFVKLSWGDVFNFELVDWKPSIIWPELPTWLVWLTSADATTDRKPFAEFTSNLTDEDVQRIEKYQQAFEAIPQFVEQAQETVKSWENSLSAKNIRAWLGEMGESLIEFEKGFWNETWSGANLFLAEQWFKIRLKWSSMQEWLTVTLPENLTSWSEWWNRKWTAMRWSLALEWELIRRKFVELQTWLLDTLQTALESFRTVWQEKWTKIRDKFLELIAPVAGMLQWLRDIWGEIQEKISGFKDWFSNLDFGVPRWLENLVDALEHAADLWDQLRNKTAPSGPDLDGGSGGGGGGFGHQGIGFGFGQMLTVGERGPETLFMPRGARLLSTDDSLLAARQPIYVTVNATVNNDVDAESLAWRVARTIQRSQR